MKLMAFQVMLPWVSITPFGRPVVPDVCGSMKTSSGRTSAPTSSSVELPSSDS
jgi:hypothetical protein